MVTIYGMEKTTVYLDEIDYRRLKRVAARRRIPPARLLREAVAEFVARHDTPTRARSLGAFRSGRGDLAEKAEALLRGFGERRR
jgi:predicted transcriptional regulator